MTLDFGQSSDEERQLPLHNPAPKHHFGARETSASGVSKSINKQVSTWLVAGGLVLGTAYHTFKERSPEVTFDGISEAEAKEKYGINYDREDALFYWKAPDGEDDPPTLARDVRNSRSIEVGPVGSDGQLQVKITASDGFTVTITIKKSK